MLLSISTFIFIKKDNYRKQYETYQYKEKLSSNRQDAWDKLRVKNVTITKRETGTAPFSPGSTSNANGFDVSPNDNYVRTHDFIKYEIEVNIEPNTNHPGVTSQTKVYGGVLKVKIKTPTYNKTPVYIAYRENWMYSTVSITDDELIGMFKFDDNVAITNASQKLSFQLLAYANPGDYTNKTVPEFEVWMEGNNPDDSTSKAYSKTAKDNKPLIISGDLDVSFGISILQKCYELKNNSYGAVVYDSIKAYSNAPDGNKGAKGVAMINDPYFIVRLEYQYKIKGSLNWQTLDMSNNKVQEFIKNYERYDNQGHCIKQIANNKIEIHIPEGLSLHETLSGDSASAEYGWGEFLPLYDDNGGQYNYRYNLYLESLNYTVSNKPNRFYLNKNSDGTITDSSQYNNSTTFEYSNIASEFPEPSSYTTEGIDEKIRHLGSGSSQYGDSTYKEYTTSIDDIFQFNIINSESGPSSGVYGAQSSIYKGGVEHLVTFNTNFFKVIKNPISNNYAERIKWKSYHDPYEVNNENFSIQFGIYKKDKNGITSNSLIETAKHEDFNWYNTAEEAQSHGKITAVNIYDKNVVVTGEYEYRIFFKTLDNSSNINKTSIIRYKSIFYGLKDSKTTGNQKYYGYGLRNYNSQNKYVPAKISNYGDTVTMPTTTDDARTYGGNLGQTMLISKARIFLEVNTYNIYNSSYDSSNVRDGYFKVEIIPYVKTAYNTKHDGETIPPTTITTVLPKNIKYMENSFTKEPSNIKNNSDGTTTIKWDIKDLKINTELTKNDYISFKILLSPQIANDDYVRMETTIANKQVDWSELYLYRSSTATQSVINLNGEYITKIPAKEAIETNQSFYVNTLIGNSGDNYLTNIKILEICPRSGDMYGNRFSGNYTIEFNKKIPNQKIYYTTTAIRDSGITTDQFGIYNIKQINLGSDNRWKLLNTNTLPSNATAFVVVGNNLNPNQLLEYSYLVKTSGNKSYDVYCFNSTLTSNMQTTLESSIARTQVVSRGLVGRAFIDYNKN